jgi:hypothetical protein
MYRSDKRNGSDQRRPVEVVEQSNQPGGALINYVAQALEGGGFSLTTAEWPRIVVRLPEQDFALWVGSAALSPVRTNQLRKQLRECLGLLDE